jgi:diphosphomevalonate decarboxylase
VSTAVAHPNIALAKYWGKRDVPLNLPAVPSLSLTLDGWKTKTTVTPANADVFVLDGVTTQAPNVFRVLDLVAPDRPRCEVVSKNDFPTGAGLASSASGFAALVTAAAAAFGRTLDPDALSVLARRGSGSACRSIHGGFVEWRMGEREDGTDSHGVGLPSDWPVAMAVAIVDERRKPVGSTAGMERCRRTSALWSAWVDQAPGDVEEARAAVLARDLERLGTVMERSTFRMHATMHTASPPLLYWQPGTVAALHAVFALRERGVGAWATMDAGPQVKVLCAPADADTVVAALEPHALWVDTHGVGGPARIVG